MQINSTSTSADSQSQPSSSSSSSPCLRPTYLRYHSQTSHPPTPLPSCPLACSASAMPSVPECGSHLLSVAFLSGASAALADAPKVGW